MRRLRHLAGPGAPGGMVDRWGAGTIAAAEFEAKVQAWAAHAEMTAEDDWHGQASGAVRH